MAQQQQTLIDFENKSGVGPLKLLYAATRFFANSSKSCQSIFRALASLPRVTSSAFRLPVSSSLMVVKCTPLSSASSRIVSPAATRLSFNGFILVATFFLLKIYTCRILKIANLYTLRIHYVLNLVNSYLDTAMRHYETYRYIDNAN